MNPRPSAVIGVLVGAVASFGAWFQFELFNLMVQSMDVLVFTLSIIALGRIAIDRTPLPRFVWGHPAARLTVGPFLGALILAPVAGVLLSAAPVSGLSSSLRFVVLLALPMLLVILRVNIEAFSRGFGTSLAVGILANLIYASLQILEFNGILPSGPLPHHQLTEHLAGSRFNDWGRASGFFLSGNHLAYYGLATFIYFLASFLQRRSVLMLLLAGSGFAAGLLGNSRSVIVLALVVLVTMPPIHFLVTKQIHRQLLQRGSIVLAAIIGTFTILLSFEQFRSAVNFNRIGRLMELAQGNLDADNSLRTRLDELWPTAIEHFRAYPLGSGVEPSTLIGTIDSAWLTYLLQGSVPLLLLFALFLFGGIFSGASAYLHRLTTAQSIAGQSLIWLIICIGAGSLLLSPHHVPSMMIILLVLYFLAAGYRPRTP